MPPPQKKKLNVTDKVKIQLPVSELKIGMYVCELDCPWEDTPFLFQGFVIETPEDIATLKSYSHYALIDKSLSKKVMLPKYTTAERGVSTEIHSVSKRKSRFSFLSKKPKQPRELIDLRQELQPAFSTFRSSNNLISSIWEDVRGGKDIDTVAAKEAVSRCVDSISRNPSALVLLTQIKNKDSYTSQHSMNVSIYSIAFGRHLGMNHLELNELGLAGLLHDAGKMLTPDSILKKPGRLTTEEFEVMKRHPADGRDILLSSSGLADSAIDVAHGHHERLHGGGYPLGLAAHEISHYTRIVAIVDFFDAITSERAYKYGSNSFQALRMLHANSDAAFDKELVTQFIECVGVFPAGTIVEMNNGEIGIVVQAHKKYRLKPRVIIVLDEEKNHCQVHYLDLSESPVDRHGQLYQIKTVRHHRDFNINLGGFIQKYLIQDQLGLI